MRKRLPQETLSRLFPYLRALLCLVQEGAASVSSKRLAELCDVKPSMVRKDLSYLGRLGTPGLGYRVEELIAAIRKALNLKRPVQAVLVGVGNIGKALLSYTGFKREGFEIVVAFDRDGRKVGKTINGVPIEDAGKMEESIRSRGIKLGIIAVPVAQAPAVARRMARAGIKGILSFAPCGLFMPEKVAVTCVDLAMEMARLAYHL